MDAQSIRGGKAERDCRSNPASENEQPFPYGSSADAVSINTISSRVVDSHAGSAA